MAFMKLSEKIPYLVSRQGISQAELARTIGTYPARISEWVSEKGLPSIYQALKMARALDVSLDYLADDDQDEPSGSATTEADRQLAAMVARYGAERLVWRLIDVGMGPELKVENIGDAQEEPPARRTRKGETG